MTAPSSANLPVLPADAHCPRCGYEFGIAGQTRCSECGLEIDAAAVRAIEVRKVARRKLLVGLGINALVLVVVAIVSLLRNGADGEQAAYRAVCMVALSLLAGFAVARLTSCGERRLWADAWARSHFLMFAHWIMLPDASNAEPIVGGVLGFTVWAGLAAGSFLAAHAVFHLLRRHRGLDSKPSTVNFVALLVVIALGNSLLFAGIVIWRTLQQLNTIAC